MIKQLVSLTTVAFAAIVTLTLTAIVLTHAETAPDPSPVDGKIKICHARSSTTNPYGPGFIDVSINATDDSLNGGYNLSTHSSHLGPVFKEGMKKGWGDIIPPVDENNPGLNWTEEGRAIWYNYCQRPGEDQPNVATATITVNPASCNAAASISYTDADAVNAKWKNNSTNTGTTGPADYKVVADADKGAIFDDLAIPEGASLSPNLDKLTFEGTLAPKLTEGCGGGGTTPQVATASISIDDNITCSVGETLTRGAISYATWSGDESGTTGPTSYTVIATAVNGAHFDAMTNTANVYVSEDLTTKTFTGTLAGPLDCTPREDEVAAANITLTQASCEAAATLTYGDIENATWDTEGSTASGATGPASYTVIAIADEGAAFPAGEGVSEDGTTMTFTGTLNPIVTEGCVLGETTDDDTTPTVLPETNSATPIATMTLLTGVTGLLVIVTQVLRGLLARKV